MRAIFTDGVLDMATSSIDKNFVVYGKRKVEKFANAIEEFAKFERN